jgi:hypothetical protein
VGKSEVSRAPVKAEEKAGADNGLTLGEWRSPLSGDGVCVCVRPFLPMLSAIWLNAAWQLSWNVVIRRTSTPNGDSLF